MTLRRRAVLCFFTRILLSTFEMHARAVGTADATRRFSTQTRLYRSHSLGSGPRRACFPQEPPLGMQLSLLFATRGRNDCTLTSRQWHTLPFFFFMFHTVEPGVFQIHRLEAQGVARHRKAGARTRVGKSNQLNSVDQSLIYPTIPFLFLIIPCFLQIFLDFFQLHFLTALWGQNSAFLQAKWLHSDFIECRSTFLQMGPKSSYYEVKVTSLNAVQLVANGAKRQS